MPALIPTDYYGTITWLGYVPHRNERQLDAIEIPEMPLEFGGYAAEHHAGLNRPACVRVRAQHPEGTEIRNTRQVTILCATQMAEVAATLGLEALDPKWLGASIVIDGIPDFTHVPPSARLQSENGTTLIVDMENRPCQYPAMTIQAAHPGHGTDYKSASQGKRGVTASVERPGQLRIGDRLRLHIPDQRPWAP